jgi:hypothetical protein
MKALFLEIRPESIDVGNMEDQSPPSGGGVALFQIRLEMGILATRRVTAEIFWIFTFTSKHRLRPDTYSVFRVFPIFREEGGKISNFFPRELQDNQFRADLRNTPDIDARRSRLQKWEPAAPIA